MYVESPQKCLQEARWKSTLEEKIICANVASCLSESTTQLLDNGFTQILINFYPFFPFSFPYVNHFRLHRRCMYRKPRRSLSHTWRACLAVTQSLGVNGLKIWENFQTIKSVLITQGVWMLNECCLLILISLRRRMFHELYHLPLFITIHSVHSIQPILFAN